MNVMLDIDPKGLERVPHKIKIPDKLKEVSGNDKPEIKVSLWERSWLWYENAKISIEDSLISVAGKIFGEALPIFIRKIIPSYFWWFLLGGILLIIAVVCYFIFF